jgi:hypothetical protein
VQPHTADRNADGTPSLNQLYCSLLCLPTAPVSSIGNSGPFGSWALYDKTRALQDDPRPSTVCRLRLIQLRHKDIVFGKTKNIGDGPLGPVWVICRHPTHRPPRLLLPRERTRRAMARRAQNVSLPLKIDCRPK